MKIIYLEMSDSFELDELNNFTKLDYAKYCISQKISHHGIIAISNIQAGSFGVYDYNIPNELLDHSIKLFRNNNCNIKWMIGESMLFTYKEKTFIFKKEPFWKFITNHDELTINWSEPDVILLYEELLQLIQGIQLDRIKFDANHKFKNEGQKNLLMEILETVKQITRAKIFYGVEEI